MPIVLESNLGTKIGTGKMLFHKTRRDFGEPTTKEHESLSFVPTGNPVEQVEKNAL